MKNIEAADVLREYIRTNSPCNGLEMALQKAITALEHQPEPQVSISTFSLRGIEHLQCLNCGEQDIGPHFLVCQSCGSSDLRPVYVSEIGRKA